MDEYTKNAIKTVQKAKIKSIGTTRNYRQCIKQYYRWCHENAILRGEVSRLENLINFLTEIAENTQQKTVCQKRMALNKCFNKKIKFIKAEIDTTFPARNYGESEVLIIVKNMTFYNALAVLICFYSGLRAHELATLRRPNESSRSNSREWSEELFMHREAGEIYIVTGKGGLRRHVMIPLILSIELEKLRLSVPEKIRDRDVYYYSQYKIGFGQALSQAFCRASTKSLKYSNGLHGLRHSYAKNRMKMLTQKNISIDKARLLISQELGHFRPQITDCYFR